MEAYVRNIISLAVSVAVAFALGGAATAAAEVSFKGKTISVYITSGSGGSVDLMARLGIRHVGRHIPGNPTVLAKNKPGAGGILGGNYVYSVAVKDGTELGTALNTVPFEPLFFGEKSKAKYDPRKFEWLGSPAKFIAVAIAWHTSKIKKWQDLLETEMVVGSSGMGSSSTIDAFVMRNLLGFKYKVILGYPSGSDIDLAMIRGETDGRATTAWAGVTSRYPGWITDKQINILYQTGLSKHPTVPKDVPLILDEVKADPKTMAALKIKMASYEIGYPVFAPPGTPKEIVTALAKAHMDTYRDKAYLAEAEKSRVEVDPLSGEQVAAIINDAFAAPPDVIKLLQDAAVAPKGSTAKAKGADSKKKKKKSAE
jgi:tripartite-type tricarboxylate transporter receptor subunit TctC